MIKFGQLILRKIIKIWWCCHQMSDFKVEMHENRFRLELRPRLRWRSLQRSLRPPSWNKGYLVLREENGAGKGREEEGGIDRGG